MSLWRLSLELESPLGTPLTSATVFGHLCWAVHRGEGEAALVDWLARLRSGDATFRVSDAFPEGMLPRPMLKPQPPREDLPTAAADALKHARKQRWIRRNSWLEHRASFDERRLVQVLAAAPATSAVHAHNRIDRHTGTTPVDGGGLWFVEDDWSHGHAPLRDLYVETDMAGDRVAALLDEVGAEGYGRDATYGRGRFRVRACAHEEELRAHDGERLMSLSHGCLDPAMVAPRYERFTHFGKVGFALAARTGRPFKRPVLVMKPGATFATGPGPFGRLLSGVHQDDERVLHDAQHVTISFTEAA